jgi:oligopeptide transport system substrate-binding protein
MSALTTIRLIHSARSDSRTGTQSDTVGLSDCQVIFSGHVQRKGASPPWAHRIRFEPVAAYGNLTPVPFQGVSGVKRPDLRRWFAAGLVTALLLSAAGVQAETLLQRGNKDEPETLDPQKADGAQEYWVQSDLFEGLTRIDPRGKIVPGVAESWEIAPDGRSWTFHLRPDLMWSDGTALTAEDFVWSLRRAVDPRTAASYASILYPIVGARAINDGTETDLTKLGVTAPDARTVAIRLETPTAYLDGVMTLGIAFPVPRRAIELYGEEWTRPGHIVGDGAFVMTSWTPELEIRLKRNPSYYDAAAVKLDGVVWSVNPDDETAMKRYRAGDLDIARAPHKQVPALKREIPAELHTGTQLWTVYLIINTRRPPFDDVRLRQALSMLIDRDTLNQVIDPHDQTTGYALVPPGIEGYTPQPPDWAGVSLAVRRERAAALLQSAGFGPSNPVQIEVLYAAAEESRRQLTAIAAMVKPYGIEFVPRAEENQVVEAAIRNHDDSAAYYGWQADYPDPWTFLSVFHSNAGGLNTSDYRNPEFDLLLDQAMAMLDPAARLRALEAAERLIARDTPVIPLSYDNWPRVVKPNVIGYFDNPLDQHQSRDLALRSEGGAPIALSPTKTQ